MGAVRRRWTATDVPDQSGRRVLVTGANSGIGFHTAQVLAGRGAEIVMACRRPEVLTHAGEKSVAQAMAEIRSLHPDAKLEYVELDLSSLAAVRAAVEDFHRRFDGLDVLINNAGLMWQPQRKTVDGFELQIGVNHLGHFAFTGLLLPALLKTTGSRIVSLSSLAHTTARLDVDDLNYERRPYDPQKVYSQTKLVNLMFSRELARRLVASGAPTIAVAAHPGVASTNLFISAFPNAKRFGKAFDRLTAVFAQSGAKGALPSLYAATASEVENGDYFGPNGLFELWGYPATAKSIAISKDLDAARRIWEVSEAMTGVIFPLRSKGAAS